MQESATQPRECPPLVDGRWMTCPRCRTTRDMLLYKKMDMEPDYADSLTPCYKCPSCRFIFAPADMNLIRAALEMLTRGDITVPGKEAVAA